jgi:SPP1 family phage portal protein
MKAYQDLISLTSEQQRIDFISAVIREHQASAEYRIAEMAEQYYAHRNPTIMNFQKFVYNQFGQSVPDVWSANNKIASNWYYIFTTQAVQYLLGNGVSFKNDDTLDKLGKGFEKTIQDLATNAKNSGVAFAYWNKDHIELFKYTEFAPIYDEETGQLASGILFREYENELQRIVLYEPDGYTEYIKRKGDSIKIYAEKRAYLLDTAQSINSGKIITGTENYSKLPIFQLWNVNKQSDIIGNRETIDAYDLMISGLINNVSDGEFIYWVLKNCGGMDAVDDAKFIEQLKLTRVTHADGDDGASVDAHKVEVEFEASETALNRLRNQLYTDFMALDVDKLSASNVTATQIKAAYEPINQKTDQFEYQVTEFITNLLDFLDIDDTPTYTRSQMSNQAETVDIIVQGASYLSSEYITTKILTLLGDADKAEEVLKQLETEGMQRLGVE